jgi:hypothetical protein
MRNSWWMILLCLGLLIAAVVWITSPGSGARCHPTFREVAEGRSVEVRVGSRQFGIKAALIGCEADLRQVDRKQEEQIVSAIEKMLRAETWRAWPKSKEKSFRLALVNEINTLLGQPVVCDVYLHSFSAAE